MALWIPGEVAIGWTSNKPIRQLPQTTLAKRRQTRMKNKIMKAAPLFADELIARELAKRPDFFDGVRVQE